MKRWMKKGVAAVLASTMLLGNFGLTQAEGDKGGNTVDVLSEAVYDEVVTFVNNVAFLENGHWPTEKGDYDWDADKYMIKESTNDITEETNIVFMDAEGNKKVIHNKDSDGGKLFDRVYPIISYSDYQMLLLVKDGKAAYLKEDGAFFGGALTWHNYAKPVTNDFMLVSEDGETWQAVNAKGEVTASNLIPVSSSSGDVFNRLSNYTIGKRLVLNCMDKTVIFDDKGNLITEYDKNLKIWPIENDYLMLRDDKKTQLLDPNGEVVREFDRADFWLSHYSNNYVIATRRDVGGAYQDYESNLIDITTGELIFTGKGNPEFDGEILVGRNQQDVVSVSSLDGTVYISDLEQYAKDLGKKEGYQSVSSQYTYVNGSLLLSIIDEADTNKTCTFALTKESGFTEDNTKKFDGIVGTVSSDEEYFTTENSEGFLRNMCTIEGKLVRSYEENEKYGNTYGIWKEHPADNRVAGNEDSTRWESMPGELIFWVDEYSKAEYNGHLYNKKEGTAYLTADGEISETYEYIEAGTGNFLEVWKSDGTGRVINSSNEIVYTNKQSTENVFWYYHKNIDINIFWYYDCFLVKDLENEKCYLYDRDGNIIFGGNEAYSNIGDTERRYYYGWREDGYLAEKLYSGGRYTGFSCDIRNYPLRNGLCITEKTENGTSKYGAIVIKGRKNEGLVKMGDVNGDGEIDAKDALAVLKYSLEIQQEVFMIEAADVDKDGKVDAKDALVILKHTLGLFVI